MAAGASITTPVTSRRAKQAPAAIGDFTAMNSHISLETRRRDLEHHLAELRRDRGAAVLDGHPVDHLAISAAEAELQAVKEAESLELERAQVDAQRLAAEHRRKLEQERRDA